MAFSYGNIWHSPDKYELSTTTWSSSSTRMLSKFILRGSCAVQNLPTCYEKILRDTNNLGHVTAKNDMLLKEKSFSFIWEEDFDDAKVSATFLQASLMEVEELSSGKMEVEQVVQQLLHGDWQDVLKGRRKDLPELLHRWSRSWVIS